MFSDTVLCCYYIVLYCTSTETYSKGSGSTNKSTRKNFSLPPPFPCVTQVEVPGISWVPSRSCTSMVIPRLPTFSLSLFDPCVILRYLASHMFQAVVMNQCKFLPPSSSTPSLTTLYPNTSHIGTNLRQISLYSLCGIMYFIAVYCIILHCRALCSIML